MAVPAKKFHPINVDGVQYLWRVSVHDEVDGIALALELRIVPRNKRSPSIVGHVDTEHAIGTPAPFAIRPRHVAAIIRHARTAEWDPAGSGKDFKLEGLERFVVEAKARPS